MTLTYEEVYKLITDQKERNFGKWQELIQELAKSIGKVQHPTFLRRATFTNQNSQEIQVKI